MLYIVATPIGNLQDMSLRAIEVLQNVNYIAAEDTRHSLPLLQHFAISTPIIALHQYNERQRAQELLLRLQDGASIALISDAGTPLISDPGYFLVSEARLANIPVVPIPGPCAAITALSAAGLATDRFNFEGFLPAKTQARTQQLELLRTETRTLIFYEAPHRIVETLQDMEKIFGSSRRAVLARELTKKYETFRAGTLAELSSFVQTDANQQRGEIVVVVEGATEVLPAVEETDRLLTILLTELPLKQAVDLATKISGGRKNELYQRALKMKARG